MPSSISETDSPSRTRAHLSPATIFLSVSIAEAITWTLLLLGMFLKYVTRTTDVGVRVFGTLHGAVFIAYGITTVLVWIDQRWPARRGIVALACAVPPFATLVFDRWVQRHEILGDSWRLRSTQPRGVFEKLASWVVRHPIGGVLLALIAVAVLFSIAFTLGPPIGG